MLIVIRFKQEAGVGYHKDAVCGVVMSILTRMVILDLVLIHVLIIASATKLTLYNIKDKILYFVLLLVDKK